VTTARSVASHGLPAEKAIKPVRGYSANDLLRRGPRSAIICRWDEQDAQQRIAELERQLAQQKRIAELERQLADAKGASPVVVGVLRRRSRKPR
jgi:hypothetical protein